MTIPARRQIRTSQRGRGAEHVRCALGCIFGRGTSDDDLVDADAVRARAAPRRAAPRRALLHLRR